MVWCENVFGQIESVLQKIIQKCDFDFSFSECNEIAISSNRMSDQECPHQEQTSVLFRLPCQHVVCRPCLSYAAEKKQCLYCKTNFEKKDVVRVHSKRM